MLDLSVGWYCQEEDSAIAGGLPAALRNGESRRAVFWLELAAAGHQHCFNASQTTSSPCKKGSE